MDSLTHTLLGACMGELIAGKTLGKKAMLIGAIVHNLPDIDMVASAWLNDTGILLAHRGITHSITGIAILSPLFAYLLSTMWPRPMPFSRWLLLIASGLVTHIVTDAFTPYGTGWFEPFSAYRVSFNSLFILDPFFMFPVLVATVALFFIKRGSMRHAWAKSGLVLSATYLLYTIGNKVYIDTITEKNLAAQHIAGQYMTAPTPLNNFLWYINVKGPHKNYTAYYSVFDDTDDIVFEPINRNDSLVVATCNAKQVNELLQFTKGYYCAGIENDTVVISDMRFGRMGGWNADRAPFVFKFKMPRHCNSGAQLRQAEFEKTDPAVFTHLFQRIRGFH